MLKNVKTVFTQSMVNRVATTISLSNYNVAEYWALKSANLNLDIFQNFISGSARSLNWNGNEVNSEIIAHMQMAIILCELKLIVIYKQLCE